MSFWKAYDGVKVDVFSAGAILFMMLFGTPALTHTSRFSEEFKGYVIDGKFQEAITLDRLEHIPDGQKVTHFITREAPSASKLSLRG